MGNIQYKFLQNMLEVAKVMWSNKRKTIISEEHHQTPNFTWVILKFIQGGISWLKTDL